MTKEVRKITDNALCIMGNGVGNEGGEESQLYCEKFYVPCSEI